MKIMAVDYGDQRTGIAVSDETGTLTGDAFVITEWDPSRAAEKIAREARARGAGLIVLGHPKNMDGTLGPRASICASFAELLRNDHHLEVVLWDERLTTVDAHRILSDVNIRGKKRKQTVDAVAASLILEGYLASLGR